MKASRVNHFAQLGLALSLTGAALALYQPLFFWVLLLTLCAAVIQLSLSLGWQKRAPERRTINLLAVLSLIVLIYNGLSAGLLEAMLNLLILGSTLKLLSLSHLRDLWQLALANLFAVATVLVFHQAFAAAIYTIALTLLILLSLMVQTSPTRNFKPLASMLAVMTLQALPIALLLFFVMPQMGPLWKMPTARSSQIGLSESMAPGDIAQLAQSEELVFRAEFDRKPPDYSQRYWRVMTMEHFDGHQWQVAQQPPQARPDDSLVPADGQVISSYQVLAEANRQHWLYNLSVSRSTDGNVLHTRDYQLRRRYPMQSAFRYQAQWISSEQPSFNAALERRINLQLPEKGNPQIRLWARQLREQYPVARDYISALLDYLRQQPFRYTLRPPPMPVNTVDQFWFQHQAGFCAHYASALAYTLRLGDIPARVVTGYLGGEMDNDGYLSVYQFDAHAWVEWLSDTGWQRIDPTAIAAPLRLDFGLEQAVADEQSFLSDTPLSLHKLKSVPLFNQLRLLLNDLDYQWSHWVLGFNQTRQRDLLQSIIGQLTATRLSLFGLAVVSLIALLLLAYQWRGQSERSRDPAVRYYLKAERLLRQRGLGRPPASGPISYQQSLGPHLEAKSLRLFRLIVRLYCRSQYQGKRTDRRRARFIYRRFYNALK